MDGSVRCTSRIIILVVSQQIPYLSRDVRSECAAATASLIQRFSIDNQMLQAYDLAYCSICKVPAEPQDVGLHLVTLCCMHPVGSSIGQRGVFVVGPSLDRYHVTTRAVRSLGLCSPQGAYDSICSSRPRSLRQVWTWQVSKASNQSVSPMWIY